MKLTKRDWIAYTVASAITVGMVYVIMSDNVDLKFLRGATRVFQGTARVVGQWGMETERLYHHLIENGRMV